MPIPLHIPFWRAEAIEIPLPAAGPFEIFGQLVQLPDVLPVQPFGLLVALGVLVGARIADRRAKRAGVHPRVVNELLGYVLIGGFVLGHVLDAVFYHPAEVLRRPIFLLELWNGLSSFGCFAGAIAGLLIWRVRRGLSVIAVADPIAFAFPFGWLFGRLGCFAVHDHPGRVTTFVLGVADYQVGLPPYAVRHDLGLYEVLWSLAASALFLWLARSPRPRGFYLWLLPILYAPVRFGLDFLRGTDFQGADPRYLGLTPGHYGALAILALGIGVALWVRSRPTLAVPPEAAWPEVDPEADDRGSGPEGPLTGAA
jgi:phosphatidylglycerol---prolipoprotein diacylglyceryl transferase